MDNEFDIAKLEKMSRAEIISDIGEDVRTLIRAHEISREPDETESCTMFDLSEISCVLPESVRSALTPGTEIEEVIFPIRISNTDQTAKVECTLSGTTQDGSPVTIFVTEDGGEFGASMIIDDSDPLPLPVHPTKEELTTLLASIFAPNKRGDYTPFAALDLHDSKVARNIEEALQKHASWYFSNQVYLSKDASRPYRIEYVVRDGTIDSATVVRPHAKASDALALDFTQSGITDEFDLAALDGARLYELDSDGRSHEVDCSTEMLISLDDFVKDIRQNFGAGTRELASSQLDRIDPDPASDYMDPLGKQFRSGDDFKD